jgi:hypothetical protein
MPDSMAAAYEDARAYYQARQQPSAGILKTLLLRRIGSSLHAGLLTAKRLRDGRVSEATREEDEQAEGPALAIRTATPLHVWNKQSNAWRPREKAILNWAFS